MNKPTCAKYVSSLKFTAGPESCSNNAFHGPLPRRQQNNYKMRRQQKNLKGYRRCKETKAEVIVFNQESLQNFVKSNSYGASNWKTNEWYDVRIKYTGGPQYFTYKLD